MDAANQNTIPVSEATARAAASDAANGFISQAEADAILSRYQPAPSGTPDALNVEIVDNGLSATEKATVARDVEAWLEKQTHMTDADKAAYRKAQGVEPPTSLSEAAQQVNVESPPAKNPAEFRFPSYFPPGQDGKMTPEINAFDQGARALLMDLNAPAEIGTALGKIVDRVALKYEGTNKGERELAKRHNTYLLQETWKESYDANLKLVQEGWAEAHKKYPVVIEHLEHSGVADDPLFINQFLTLLKLQARRKGF